MTTQESVGLITWLANQRANATMIVTHVNLTESWIEGGALIDWSVAQVARATKGEELKSQSGWLLCHSMYGNINWSGQWTFHRVPNPVPDLPRKLATKDHLANASEFLVLLRNACYLAQRGAGGAAKGIFFELVGAKIQANREVAAWMQPLLVEFGEGLVVLFRDSRTDKLLVQAKLEPGNPKSLGHILLGASVQASMSNFEAAHGGKRPQNAPYIMANQETIKWVRLAQDGGRFLEKWNTYAVVNVTPDQIDSSGMYWATPDELREAIRLGNCNEHLLQAVALLW